MISIFHNLENPTEVYKKLSLLTFMTKKIRVYRHLLFIFAAAVLFILNKIVFGQSAGNSFAVFVDNPFDEIAKIIGLVTSIIFCIGVIVGIIWFFWKGKDNTKLQDDLKAADARNARLSAELSSEAAKTTKLLAYINALRRARKVDRKLIYRLSAKKENIEIDIDEEIHESDIADLDIDSNFEFLEAL